MSQALDTLFQHISSAAQLCYTLNSNGEITIEEQTVFYQYAEQINHLLSRTHQNYDKFSSELEKDSQALNELNTVWTAAASALTELTRSVTSPKMRAAIAAVSYAIDRTSSIAQIKIG